MEMMGLERLIDSVILIDHLNGIEKATRFLENISPEASAISVITRAEILSGLDEKDWEMVLPLLEQYRLLQIDAAAADLAARLRRQFHWRLPDAFQAALASLYRIRLITRNTKDFDPQKHKFIEIPYLL